MGRKGMKGFMKSAARPSSKTEDEPAEQEQPAQPAAAPSKAEDAQTSSQPAKTAAPASSDAAEAGNEADNSEGQKETRGQMLQRHKREMLAHKKAVQRTGKKSKDELAKLDADIEARHAKELQDFDAAAAAPAPAAAAPSTSSSASTAAGAAAVAQASAGADGSASAADRASKYLRDLSVGDEAAEVAEGQSKKLTKAQKRREKAAAKDAEREARIAAELAELGPSERATEEAALAELLLPLGLGIKEIRADGHCLYRSLEDQLQQAAQAEGDGSSSEQPDYQQLRQLAAQHIRQHKEQFAPFLLPDDEDEDPDEHYDSYCDTIETTAAWGGHLELTALSAALKRHVRVHAVGMDTISLGEEEHQGKLPLEVCYLRHAFGLGEHYNSTKKLLFVADSDGDGSADDEQQQQQQPVAGEEEITDGQGI